MSSLWKEQAMTGWRRRNFLALLSLSLGVGVVFLSACTQQAPPNPASGPARIATEGRTIPREEARTVSPEPDAPTQNSSAPEQPAAPQPNPTPTQQPATSPPQQQSSPLNVEIKGFEFVSSTITVPVGATVTWTNRDLAPHTITSQTALFDSGTMSRDATFSYTFKQDGTFEYFCDYHPLMTGKVVVTE
ncbi:MAG: cupredoxin domain-containing protein [Chloroflexi bacterium]|nr:cupredoxin domain-containing protein [Chloroflexota bacterium]